MASETEHQTHLVPQPVRHLRPQPDDRSYTVFQAVEINTDAKNNIAPEQINQTLSIPKSVHPIVDTPPAYNNVNHNASSVL